MAIEVPFGELNPRTCTVVGGRGFIGRSLVFNLLKLGNWIVRVVDSAQSLQLDLTDSLDSSLNDAISSGRASYHYIDVIDISVIAKAIEGSSVVFYMEATDLWTHDFYYCYRNVVQGAKNVIDACRQCKVRKLIYNSSADVIFDGSHDICNGDESLPCHWRFEDMLNDLKAHAEALVLFANNIDGLLTCALRPSNVFGPGDTQLLPFLISLAKSGCAKFIIGSGENMSDFTYVENVAHAHICAAEALDSRMVCVAGKAFFITNLEPMKFWEFASLILEALSYQRPLIKLPAQMVWYVLLFIKWMHEKLGFSKYNHSMSAYFFRLASHTRTFNCIAAQKYIGYSPVVSLDDGIALTIEAYSNLVKDPSFMRCPNFEEESKVDKLLGGGKVADILLWRDEKKTFTYFLIFAVLFYWFLLSGRTFTSSAARLLLLSVTILYGYGFLPLKISGFTIQRISLSWFEISETMVKDSVTSIASLWNRGVHNIRLLVQGKDSNRFLKVLFVLYSIKLILLQSFTVVAGITLVFAFTAFFVYEQYEAEVDGLMKLLLSGIEESKRLLMRKLPAPVASFLQNKGMLNKED
ncbi:hydroxysteroid dehydrogenase, putative [Ricinus communis]|uniref:Reticulon-like protein n=1 Tax=Ricinus communis TaxID=3988 RepID=B9SU06_RICCO|nr:hydroxysteroid dehydrogenase, putative [Ricinus communis]|eukprot:XP_002529475.1 3beta-hydroxysteroid-dehydrogenase/decarboxylase [Ricinus communis]